MQITAEGDVVQIILNGTDLFLTELCRQRFRIEKKTIDLTNFIGQEYGRLYQIEDNRLVPVLESVVDHVMDDIEADPNMALNNSEYIDTNTSQKLEQEDISGMRAGGISGNDIVKALVENSDTWSKKTVFAKRKYLERKNKKHNFHLRLLPVTAKAVCDFALKTKADRILYDTISRIIGQADVATGSVVLAFDDALGLIVGCIASKLRGDGTILAPYIKGCPSFNLFSKFGLNEAQSLVLEPFPVSLMKEISNPNMECVVDACTQVEFPVCDDDDVKVETKQQDDDDDDEEADENDQPPIAIPSSSPSFNWKKKEFRSGDIPMITDILQSNFNNSSSSSFEKSISSLIIVSKCDPLEVLKLGLCFLSPGRPFVVYAEFIEPLVKCYEYVRGNNLAVNVMISDIWTRNYVMSDDVTHPLMNMNGCSGYLLVGVKILSSERPVTFPPPNNKRKTKDKGKRKKKRFE